MKKRPNRQQRPANMSPLPRQRSARAGVSTRELRLASCELRRASPRRPRSAAPAPHLWDGATPPPPAAESLDAIEPRRNSSSTATRQAGCAAARQGPSAGPPDPDPAVCCPWLPATLRLGSCARLSRYRQTAAAPTPCSAAASLHLVSIDLANCLA